MRVPLRSLAVAVVWTLAVPRLAWPAGVTYNIYFGDLHGHTMDSPVTLTTSTVDAYIRYARDTRGLNFVALTEKDFDLSASEWSDCKSRAAAFTTSSFVAFSAFEWGDKGTGNYGHRPVLYATDDQPIFYSEQPSSDNVSELLDLVSNTTNGFTNIAHPDLSNYATDWDYFDGTSDRNAEIYSRHGYFETGTHGIQQALAQGYRFGLMAVGDSRTGQPGDYGLTAVLSTGLSKSALHAAIKARRVYATTGAKILLQATMDGHAMGEEYASSTGPTLTLTCTPTAAVQKIEILKNNSVVYTYNPLAMTAPAPDSTWRRVPDELTSADWMAPLHDDSSWPTSDLEGELEVIRKPGQSARLRRRFHLDAGADDAIVRCNLPGEYRLFLNGELLVDTRTFQFDDPNRPHDCDDPSAHVLAGTPEAFRGLGFYDVHRLGGRLRAGENVVGLEYDTPGIPLPEPDLAVLPIGAATPVSFTWADGSFTGGSFYYVRVTQTDGHQAWSSPWFVDRAIPDTTPPAAAARLRARKDANDVYLEWPKVTKDVNGNPETVTLYRIFRGATADFVLDRAGRTNQIGTTSRKSYRDGGALNAAGDYYYRIVAVDAANNESPSGSNLAFMVHHPLSFHSGIPNVYWLSIPYQATYTTADQLARDLNRGASGACTKVVKWEPTTQTPTSWVYLGGQWMGSNFPLVSGQAVAIMIRQNMDALLVGAHDPGSSVRLTYTPGVPSLNWIALPICTANQLAYQVLQDLNGGYAPTVGTRLVRLNPDLQVEQTYQWTGSSWSGTNFVILPGEAFGVQAAVTADWIPATPPLP